MGPSTRPKPSRTAPASAGSGPSRISDPESGASRIRTDAALTFDDVLLVPRRSGTHPKDVNIVSRFTRGITLNVPLVAAAMDTVTESEMAIALAQEGGLGVIHKNMSIERQTEEVDKVKRSANGIITDPVTLPPDASVGRAREVMDQHVKGCLHCVDHFCRLVEVNEWLRDNSPLGPAEAQQYLDLLGIAAPKASGWKRWLQN